MRLSLRSAAATQTLGRALAQAVERENLRVFLFFGDLGVGKTTLIRALVEALPGGKNAETSSPSFTICNIYCTKPTVHHFDLYRLEPGLPDESLEESLDDTGILTIVEWSERLLAAGLPADGLTVSLARGEKEDERVAELAALGPAGERLLKSLAGAADVFFRT